MMMMWWLRHRVWSPLCTMALVSAYKLPRKLSIGRQVRSAKYIKASFEATIVIIVVGPRPRLYSSPLYPKSRPYRRRPV